MIILVIIDYFYIIRARFRPAKTKPVLIVDPDAVLASTIALEGLQPIARRHAKVAQSGRNLKLTKLSHCHSLDPGESSDALTRG